MRRFAPLSFCLLAACVDGPEVEIVTLGGITTGERDLCEPVVSQPAQVEWDAGAGSGYFVSLQLRNSGGESVDLEELDVEFDRQGFWEFLPAARRAQVNMHLEPNGGMAEVAVELLDAELAAELTAEEGPLGIPAYAPPLRLRLSAAGGPSYEFTLSVCNKCQSGDMMVGGYVYCSGDWLFEGGCALGQYDGRICVKP